VTGLLRRRRVGRRNENSTSYFLLLVALVAASLAGPPKRAQARRAPSDLTHAPRCDVKTNRTYITPDHEPAIFDWTLKVGGDRKAGLLAFTETDWVESYDKDVSITIPTGRQARPDVKEWIRGWCRLFPTKAEADIIKNQVRRLLLDRRRKLVDRHKRLRSDINKAQDDMDKEFKNQAAERLLNVRRSDLDEAIHNDKSEFDKLYQAREKGIERDADLRDRSKRIADRLQASIDQLDGEEEGVMRDIEGVDRSIRGLMDHEARCVVVEVYKVRFEKVLRDLDANPRSPEGSGCTPTRPGRTTSPSAG
jgi:hypothetical protein